MAGGTGQAAGMIVVGMGTIALVDSSVRLVTPAMGLWQYQILRAVICAGLLSGVAVAMGWRLRPVRPWAVWLRGAVASLAIVLYFGALAVMTLNQAGAGMFTAPVWVLVISVLAFGLRVGWVRTLAVAVGFAGVLAVLRPFGGEGLPLWAAALALSAGLCHAAGAVLTRQLCAAEPTAGLTVVHFIAMGLWGALGLGVVTWTAPEVAEGAAGWFARGWVWPPAAALFWTAANAVGSTLAMGLVIRAYQTADASSITVFEYAFLPFAALWSWLLFADLPDAATVLGTVMIVAGGVLILWRRSGPRTPPLTAE